MRTRSTASSDADQYGLRTSSDVRTGVISGTTFKRKSVRYSVVDGFAMFEGDIVLGSVEEMEALAERDAEARGGGGDDARLRGIAVTGERFRWPHGIVPYIIDPDMPNQSRVTDAIAHWELQTPIRFVLRTAQNASQFPNYVKFHASDGCWSEIGMRNKGEQLVSLGSGCTTGSAIHEIGHTVGLWHEQSREDRDSFVEIKWSNIIDKHRHNFDQHITDGDDLGLYDYDSIMHYPSFTSSFAIDTAQPTIVPVGGQAIGQRSGLSKGDIDAVLTMYPNLAPSKTWGGVLFHDAMPAQQTTRMFSRQWPAHWYVLFTIVSNNPVSEEPQVGLKVLAERQADNLVKYWFDITNPTANPVQFELRYEVLGWAR